MMVLSSDNNFIDILKTTLFRDLYFWWPINLDYHINTGGDWRVEVILGAVLTQNTKWSRVELALRNFFDNNIVFSVDTFSKIDKTLLKILIKPVSFYNIKSLRIINLFKEIRETFGDIDSIKTYSSDFIREFLLSLGGIGRETADVILLYAIEKPVFIIDTYTFRFTKNYLGLDVRNYDKLKTFYERGVRKYINDISNLINSIVAKIDCKLYIKRYFNYSFDNIVELPLNPCMLRNNTKEYEKLIIVFKELHAQIDMYMKNIKSRI